MLDHGDFDAKDGERASVLTTDHPAADDQHLLRHFVESEDLVRVKDAFVIEREDRRPVGRRSDGDQDDLGSQVGRLAVDRHDRDGCGVDERALAVVQVDLVPRQVLEDSHALVGGDVLLVNHEVADGHLLLEREVDAREVAIAEAGEEERGLAEGFRRERPRVRPRASEGRLALDDRDRLAEVRGLRRPLLARRARADDHQIVRFHVHG